VNPGFLVALNTGGEPYSQDKRSWTSQVSSASSEEAVNKWIAAQHRFYVLLLPEALSISDLVVN
jgi:hypothetical protein